MSNSEYLYLTTIGRRSGKPREIEIWFADFNGSFYLIAEFPTSNWVQNVRANSSVQVRVGERHFDGYARVLQRSEDIALIRAIKALFHEKYSWSDGVVVELSPTHS